MTNPWTLPAISIVVGVITGMVHPAFLPNSHERRISLLEDFSGRLLGIGGITTGWVFLALSTGGYEIGPFRPDAYWPDFRHLLPPAAVLTVKAMGYVSLIAGAYSLGLLLWAKYGKDSNSVVPAASISQPRRTPPTGSANSQRRKWKIETYRLLLGSTIMFAGAVIGELISLRGYPNYGAWCTGSYYILLAVWFFGRLIRSEIRGPRIRPSKSHL